MTQWGAAGANPGQFTGFGTLAVDKSNNVYVADTGNARIQKFSTSGTYLSQWRSLGTDTGFSGLAAVTVDRNADYVYVAETNRVQVFTYRGGPAACTTLAASGITSNAATLNATVIPNGIETIACFQWGLTTNYGNITAMTHLGGGALPVTVASPISSLAPGTRFHYLVIASNSFGRVNGADLSFIAFDMPRVITQATFLSQDQLQLQFAGGPDISYRVLTSTNIALPVTNWAVLGQPRK